MSGVCVGCLRATIGGKKLCFECELMESEHS